MESSTVITQVVETVPLRVLPQVGWFPDASGSTPPGTLRRWDGHAWTAELRPEASEPLAHGSAA
jgi:hypothetical protein